jgi:hypothetical protein
MYHQGTRQQNRSEAIFVALILAIDRDPLPGFCLAVLMIDPVAGIDKPAVEHVDGLDFRWWPGAKGKKDR